MHIDKLEKFWIWLTTITAFVATAVIGFYALHLNIHPPSNVETIDSSRLHLSKEFNEKNLGVKKNTDGSITVTLVAARYGFFPSHITVPANTPVKLRIASPDVLHGFHVPGLNFATMVIPGYVSEVNANFPKTGEFFLLCNEFCGLGHDHMWSKLTVTNK